MAIPLSDFQYIPNFIKEINDVFQKFSLTYYSEDRNEGAGGRQRTETGTRQVEPMDWPPSHCGALKEFVAKGMSYRDAADAPNAEFGTAWSRSTAPGRAWRIGLPGSGAPKSPALVTETRIQQGPRPGSDESALRELLRGRRPVFQRLEGVRLRCVEVDPRHLELVDLERDDCRYPYGGDEEGEAITFCGRPRRQGSSYCTPHFHLTRNTDVPAGRPASAAPLRLVVAV